MTGGAGEQCRRVAIADELLTYWTAVSLVDRLTPCQLDRIKPLCPP